MTIAIALLLLSIASLLFWNSRLWLCAEILSWFLVAMLAYAKEGPAFMLIVFAGLIYGVFSIAFQSRHKEKAVSYENRWRFICTLLFCMTLAGVIVFGFNDARVHETVKCINEEVFLIPILAGMAIFVIRVIERGKTWNS